MIRYSTLFFAQVPLRQPLLENPREWMSKVCSTSMAYAILQGMEGPEILEDNPWREFPSVWPPHVQGKSPLHAIQRRMMTKGKEQQHRQH
mmetsp:Transcript_9711/g.26478  ORF Transcript_9711/g.26478 Transcript_9711/m.26478 type:complete len:90 (-) Transcript_9711:157-426(-)